jgi:hypothetical protein
MIFAFLKIKFSKVYVSLKPDTYPFTQSLYNITAAMVLKISITAKDIIEGIV